MDPVHSITPQVRIDWPSQVMLYNPIGRNAYTLHFVGTGLLKPSECTLEVAPASWERQALLYEIACGVCECALLAGVRVEPVDPKEADADIRLEVHLDGILVVSQPLAEHARLMKPWAPLEPERDASLFTGWRGLGNPYTGQPAQRPDGRPFGIFAPNGTNVRVRLVGEPRVAKAVRATVELAAALYTTTPR